MNDIILGFDLSFSPSLFLSLSFSLLLFAPSNPLSAVSFVILLVL